MADLVFNFSYSRSLTTGYNLPSFLPLKRCNSSPLHIHNSRIKRSSPHLLLFFKPSPFAASASDIDVISVHERPDGSFLFRFGDPSEIKKIVEMEESKSVEEETEGESKNGSSAVKLGEGDDEIEASDDSIDSSNDIVTVEGETEFSDKLVEDDTELPVFASNSISTPDLDMERFENVEDIDEENKDTSLVGLPDETSKIENTITTLELPYQSSEVVEDVTGVAQSAKDSDDITSSDVDTDKSGKEEEGQWEDAPVLYKSSEVMNGASTVARIEKETDTSTSAIGIEQTGDVEEGINSTEVSNTITTEALTEKETDGISVTSDIEIEPTGDVEEGINITEVSNIITTEALTEKGTDGISVTSDIEIEPTGDVEEGINSTEVSNIITTEALTEKGTDGISVTSDIEIEPTGDVEEGINSTEVSNIITTEAFTEKGTDGISVTSDIEIEPTGDVEEGINSTEVSNIITTEALTEKGTDGISATSDIEIEPTGDVEEGINSTEVSNIITTEALTEKGTDGIYVTSDIEIEPTGDVEECINSSEVSNAITAEASTEKETDGSSFTSDIEIEPTGKVEDDMNEKYVDSLSDTSVLDKRSEVLNVINSEESSEKETADIISTSDIDIEHTGHVEQGTDEVLEEPSSGDSSTPDKSSFNTNPVVAVLETDSDEGSLETTCTTNVDPISEHQNEESVTQDETTGESSETDANNIEATDIQNVLSNKNESDMYSSEDEPPTMEPAIDGTVNSEEQASGSQSGIPNETVDHATEKDVIQLLTVPHPTEETGTETVEKPWDDDASENQTVGVDLVEASVHEVIAPESTDFTITRQEILTTDFVLSSGAAQLPHPSKVLTGGEDAYFIAGNTWLGLADGVSQWSLEGTSEGVYALELIKNCEKLVSDYSDNSIKNPIELLNLSVAQTHSAGASTVLIAQFDGQSLHVANVGDSGFIVLRHGAVYTRSSPMHHAFSLPVLIERGDDPSCIAQLYRVDLEEDDLVVLATDGLLDNLYDQEISLITTKSVADHKSAEEIAMLLAKRAQEVGSSASARSPFADEAQAAGFPGYSGGKLDDVTVVVSIVQRRR